MKKSSMIFKVICLAVCFALFIAVVPTFAEDVLEGEAVVETDEELVTESEVEEEVPAEDESLVEDDSVEEVPSDVENEEVSTEEPSEENEEEPSEDVSDVIEEEVLDLFTATLRDGGIYVTPSMYNAAVFTHDGLRYKVAPATGNSIRLNGFESDVKIEEEELSAKDKNRLYANAEITTQAAHSGYFGLSVYPGDFVYRVGVTEGTTYVFSAWVKMPKNATFDDMGRAFTVTSETTGDVAGTEYIVGWNEIGRDIDLKNSWQQIIFTFKAPTSGLFAIDFEYSGDTLFMDDIELYETEIFDNPLEIKKIVATDGSGEVFIDTTSEERLPGSFSTSGKITHTTTFYNSDEDDVYFTGVMALYKNDILIDIEIVEECALILDEADITFEIEIPEDDDLSQYKYLVYFVNADAPTQFYGKVPSRTNPYVVKGN